MKNPFLIGASIYLRPLERSDAPMVQTWINDPEVARTLTRYRPVNLQNEEEFIDKLTHGEDTLPLVIVVKETDRPIGVMGLHQIDFKNRHACFGILLGEKEEWVKGYGTEATSLIVRHAFETLNLNRVWLYVHEYNQRGVRAYEKAGFRLEGRLRQDVFRGGRYWDTLVMGVLRDEWRAAPRETG